MWIELTVVDEENNQTTCPINMDNVVTYTPINNDGKYPEANAVLYTTGMFVQTMPVTQTVAEIAKLMEQAA